MALVNTKEVYPTTTVEVEPVEPLEPVAPLRSAEKPPIEASTKTKSSNPKRQPKYLVQTIVLVAALVLFFVPLLASAAFGFSLPDQFFTLDNLLGVVDRSEFWPPLQTSLLLAVLTMLASLALVLPTLLWLHIRIPKLLPVAEWFSVIPFVIPAIALVSGAGLFFRAVAPGFLVSIFSLVPFYVVLALPLTYRSIDAGIRSIDVKTLYAASTSLGAGFYRTMFQAILPNLRSAVLSASLLCFALAIGEFALASLLLHETFPVMMVQIGSGQPRAAAALSFLSIVVTWLILMGFSLATRRVGERRRSFSKPSKGTAND